MSLTLLLRSYLVTSGNQRKQVTLIFAWYAFAVVTVFVPVFTPVPNYINPGIFGLLILLVATTYSLRKFGLFTVNPQYKTHMFDEIGESVVILNAVGSVIDFNQPAAELLELDDHHLGQSATAVFAENPDLKEVIEGEVSKRTVTRQTETGQRYFAATTSPFTYGRELFGTILVLRDVTPIERQERELDVLRQVFARVFRHNMRNELNVIRGHVRNVQPEVGDDPAQELQVADRSVERLLDHSKKARQIEEIVGGGYENYPQSLSRLASEVVSDCRERYPDATIVDNVDDVSVTVVSRFGRAIENAIENAVEHNPDSVVVELGSEVHDDTVTLVVEDDGVGIPETEIQPLRDGRETDLSHISGVGLWLMKWYVEKSNGTFDIKRTESGTRVEMRLNRD
jgi:sensor histidine kinase regulating citrate/malate metabolism